MRLRGKGSGITTKKSQSLHLRQTLDRSQSTAVQNPEVRELPWQRAKDQGPFGCSILGLLPVLHGAVNHSPTAPFSYSLEDPHFSL